MADRKVGPLSDMSAKAWTDRVYEEILDQADKKANAGQEIFNKEIEEVTQKEVREKLKEESAKIDKARKTTRNNASIAKSTAINKARMAKIEARTEKIQQIADEVKGDSNSLAKDGDFIAKLIVQSALMLLEDSLKIRCRKCDATLVKGVLPQAAKLYNEVIKQQSGAEKNIQLDLHEESLDDSRLGGVMVCVTNGNITVDNTIAARLALVLELDKPAIRQKLFRD